MITLKATLRAIALLPLLTLAACSFQSLELPTSQSIKIEEHSLSGDAKHKGASIKRAATTTPNPTPIPAPTASKNRFIPARSSKLMIVLDPGHGGTDLGAVGPEGLIEKEYVLELARGLREELLRRRIGEVILTRNEDIELKLSDRTQLANSYEADLFISLHANATSAHNASGLETYYLDMKGDAASRLLAERENASMGKQNLGDIEFILSDLIQTGKIEESIILTHSLHNSLVKRLKPHYSGLRDHGVKKGPFYVLVGAHMPCTLAEILFIDSKLDSKKIMDPRFRSEIVMGLADGIERYLKKVKKLS